MSAAVPGGLAVRFVVLGFMVVLCACSLPVKVAPAGEYRTDSGISVELAGDWSVIPARTNRLSRGDVLTRDGVSLNRLHLVSLAPGEALALPGEASEAPVFQPGLEGEAQVAFLLQSLEAAGLSQLQASQVRPQAFGAIAGTRLALSGRYDSGLDLRGTAALAETGGKLHLIVFIAPAGHYHDRNAGEVSGIIESAVLN